MNVYIQRGSEHTFFQVPKARGYNALFNLEYQHPVMTG